MAKSRLNVPLPQQVFDAAHRVAGHYNRHANELVEEILRDFLKEKGIDCNQPMAELLAQLDSMGFPATPAELKKRRKKDTPIPTTARSKRAA